MPRRKGYSKVHRVSWRQRIVAKLQSARAGNRGIWSGSHLQSTKSCEAFARKLSQERKQRQREFLFSRPTFSLPLANSRAVCSGYSVSEVDSHLAIGALLGWVKIAD